MKKILSIIFASCLVFQLSAQEKWSLEKCIQYAQTNSLVMKQSEIAVKNNEITLTQNKMSRYPNLNASSGLNMNFGRTLDLSTYDYVNKATFFNNLGLSSNVILYQGGRTRKSIEQSKIDIRASKLDVEQSSRDIGLQVAQAYLQILLSSEQLVTAEQRLQQSKDQLAQTERLINAGTLPKNNALDVEAQIARDEQTVIAASNAVDISYLNLKQLMTFDMKKDLAIIIPEVNISQGELPKNSAGLIYSDAVKTQANIQAGDLRVKSAELGEDIARTGKKPVISANFGMNSNYSSAAEELNTSTNPPSREKISYFDQVSENLGTNVGVSISYPIWDRKQTKLAVERARLNQENVRIQNEQLRQRLMVDIQNAIANAAAAQKTYSAAERSLTALKASYDNTDRRYKVGSATVFELNTARNNMALAESELIRSKYDYIFRLKILDFYQGKKITLK